MRLIVHKLNLWKFCYRYQTRKINALNKWNVVFAAVSVFTEASWVAWLKLISSVFKWISLSINIIPVEVKQWVQHSIYRIAISDSRLLYWFTNALPIYFGPNYIPKRFIGDVFASALIEWLLNIAVGSPMNSNLHIDCGRLNIFLMWMFLIFLLEN